MGANAAMARKTTDRATRQTSASASATAPGALHLVKLCVGVETPEELAAWQKTVAPRLRRAHDDPRPRHRTRMTPTRREALLNGGSIYWVMRGVIRARQEIVALEPCADEAGVPHCDLVFAPTLIATEPQPRRPFQGWRYLRAEDAPADLQALATGAVAERDAVVPPALLIAVSEFGVR